MVLGCWSGFSSPYLLHVVSSLSLQLLSGASLEQSCGSELPVDALQAEPSPLRCRGAGQMASGVGVVLAQRLSHVQGFQSNLAEVGVTEISAFEKNHAVTSDCCRNAERMDFVPDMHFCLSPESGDTGRPSRDHVAACATSGGGDHVGGRVPGAVPS